MQDKHVQKGSQAGLIKDVQKQGKKRASPQLFSLSSLQSAMNKRYHASASQTSAAIQSLYEDKTRVEFDQTPPWFCRRGWNIF